MNRLLRSISKILILVSTFVISISFFTNCLAAAYQVTDYFYSDVATGDAGAGGAALAQDASTVFTNPAGMVRIQNPEVVGVGSLLSVDAKFTGSNTWNTTLLPAPLNTYTQTGTAQSQTTQFIPALHLVIPTNSRFSFGFSVAPTYGLLTSYPNTSIVRYNSTESQLQVIDISPAVAYDINKQWSAGAGVDLTQAYFVYRAMAGLPSLTPAAPTTSDTQSKNTGDGWGFGGHVGLLYQMTPCTRFGLNYRSRISILAESQSTISGPLANATFNNFHTTIVLPAETTLSAYTDLNRHWAVDGSINYTQWSSINNGSQTFYNVAAPGAPAVVTQPWHYKNSWLFALGGIFKASECWTFRAGAHFDETPIPSNQVIPAVPDANRWALGVGAHYQILKQVGVDLGWSHLWLKDANITAPITIASQTSTPNGTSRTHADIVSGQITWDLA